MKTVTGNLITLAEEGKFDIIIHGCNCMCRMKRGIAGQLASRYPQVPAVDDTTKAGDWGKLGDFTYAHVYTPTSFGIVNAYTQYHWAGPNNFEYFALIHAMKKILSYGGHQRYGFPLIGGGLGGGNPTTIRDILEDVTVGYNATLVELDIS